MPLSIPDFYPEQTDYITQLNAILAQAIAGPRNEG